MIWFLYNISIRIFLFLLSINSYYNSKSRKTLKGRIQILKFSPKTNKRILVHCASLGEFEQARSVIEKLYLANNEIILSFFSPSGYEIMKNYSFAHQVIYLPFDTRKNAINFIDDLNPDLAIFVKYEFWWNILNQLNSRRVPVIFIAASFRKDQYFFRKIFSPFLKVLKDVTHFFVIDDLSLNVLYNFQIINSSVAGDTRVESISLRQDKGTQLPVIQKFLKGEKAIIYGSTYSPFNKWFVNEGFHKTLNEKVIIFPHEIHSEEINEMTRKLGDLAVVYSNFEKNELEHHDYSILIVDKIGILADAYRYAKLAYIGGGFKNGIHNILEPFVYKIPLIFGPKYSKFQEAVFLSNKPFVAVIKEINEIPGKIEKLLSHTDQDDVELSHRFLFNPDIFPSQKIIEYLQQNKFINDKK